MEIKSNEPRITLEEISEQLGSSDSTIETYRDDNNMDSRYNRNNYKKKTSKRKANTNITSKDLP